MFNSVRVFIAFLTLAVHAQVQAEVTPPQKFFGFQLGADRQIARWDKIVDYFQLLEKQGGGRMQVVNMGKSTMGHPFLLAIISAPKNVANLDRLRQVNAKISDPRGLAEPEVKRLVAEGRAVVCQSMSLHASEIGGTQMAPELAYDLLSRTDDETQRILDNVVFLQVPSFNPDGQIMVTDWYRKTLGGEYEGAELPWLYHKYAGHDNNRDAFQTNLVESQYMARILFREWAPQAYVDHHHQSPYNARIYIPPYAEPVRPLADPLIWREISWYGAHMAYKEEEAGKSGVVNNAIYSGWGHFGFHWITPFHNIAGMLTESASTRLATPILIHPDQLKGAARGMPAYEEQTSFPNPWPGGWWRLRDIVERQKIAAWALLDLAARNRETVLWNAYLKAKRQTERGAAGKPAAYVIPPAQHDPLTMAKMVQQLLLQGVEVKRSPRAFSTKDGRQYPAGSYVVPLAQPKMGLIRYLLGRTRYPDNEWTRARDGSPISPYDMATDTMFEFMGVRVDPVDEAVAGDLVKLGTALLPPGKVAADASAYILDGRWNDSFRVVNILLEKGVAVRRVDKPAGGVRAGDFLTGSLPAAVLEEVTKETGVSPAPLAGAAPRDVHEVKRLRVGLYQRYRGGNADEGWTRLLLEQFRFPYASLLDTELKKGKLQDKFDVIILPQDSTGTLVGPGSEEGIPPEYRSGFGSAGSDALKAFVQKGGTLVTLGGASNFAIEKLAVKVRNVAVTPAKTATPPVPPQPPPFWCPGSTLKVKFENVRPLAYGMPADGLVVFMPGSAAFEIVPSDHNERYETVVRYADRDLLESGWLIGEETLAKKAAMVSAQLGQGRVVLIGFRVQHRAQTHGTFKLLFNALLR
jgi:hypothetical protein